MFVRIVNFLIGALLAAGGGYLLWSQRQAATDIFPAGPDGAPWLLIGGVAATIAGLVFIANAVIPRPKRAARKAAEARWREAKLSEADTYYAEQAKSGRKPKERERAADRDWRSGDLPPTPKPQPAAGPAPAPEERPEPAADALLKPAPTPPQLEPLFKSPEPAPPKPSAGKPVATSIPPEAPPPTPFPSAATLAPIPRPPAAPPPPAAGPAPAPDPAAAAPSPFDAIRAAIAQGRLDEADKLLSAERDRAQGEQLAELTGLAGDHAAAAGRQSNAKWLWRLALKRFGECNAMNSPAARAVSERLRLADT